MTTRTLIRGEQREQLAARAAKLYREQGASVRAVAAELAVSYGFAHRLLVDAGVELRARGGARRRRAQLDDAQPAPR